MFREQMITFLQAVVVFLLITNAFTIAAALTAIRLVNGRPEEMPQAVAAQRRLNAMIGKRP